MSSIRIETDVAWAAGLFEGEGTITLNGKQLSPRLKLSMTDFDVVRRFAKIVRVGHLCPWIDDNPKHLPQLCWYTGRKKHVAEVLNLLSPYFGKRRRKRARIVLKRATLYGLKAYRRWRKQNGERYRWLN